MSLSDDLHLAALSLIELEGEPVQLGDNNYTAFVDDIQNAMRLDDEGAAAGGVQLNVIVASKEKLTALQGKTAIVRGETYFIDSVIFSGSENQFVLVASGDS